MCHFHSFSTKTTSGERKHIIIFLLARAFESLESPSVQDSLCAHKLRVEADGGLGQSCRSLDLLTKRLKTTHDALCIS